VVKQQYTHKAWGTNVMFQNQIIVKESLSASLKAGIPRKAILDHSKFYLRRCTPFGGIWGTWRGGYKVIGVIWLNSLISLINHRIGGVTSPSTETLHIHLIVLILTIRTAYLLAQQKKYRLWIFFLLWSHTHLIFMDYFLH